MVTAAKFPAATAALSDFGGELPNFPEMVLSGSHNASVTTITLTATVLSTWPTVSDVTIDSEIIHYTGKSGATLTGCTRGAQGTTAATHADAAKVGLYLTAATVNQVLAEVIAVETGMQKGADLTSATSLVLGTDGNYFHVTGTTTITSITPATAWKSGRMLTLEFDGALILTHNGTSLILQGAANFTTAAGDVFQFVSEGSGNWREVSRRLATAAITATAGITMSGSRMLLAKGADIASATAVTPGTDGNYFHITGTTAITSFASLQAGSVIFLEFDGILTLTYNATNLILQGATNMTTAAGDMVALVSEGSGNWRELFRRTAAASSAGKTGGQTAKASITGNLTTSSTSYVDATGLTVTITTTGGDVIIWFSGYVSNSNANSGEYFTLLADTVDVAAGNQGLGTSGGSSGAAEYNFVGFVWRIANPGAGSHTYKIQWKVDSNTGTLYGNPQASLVVEETTH